MIVQMSVALWADALVAYAYAYDRLIATHWHRSAEALRPNVSCGDISVWPFGVDLHSKFSQVSVSD